MPSARRWSVSDGRTLISVLLLIVAVFLISASVGGRYWITAAIGVALLAAAIAFYVVSALNSREYAYIPGTAHVVSCSAPPAGAAQGRCEMQLVVHAPGQGDVAVKVRDVAPVAKWPDAGATLPILVAVGDPRRVRVLWDRIRTHGEVAEEREEAQEYQGPQYPDEVLTTDDTYLDDILDEEAYDDEPPLVDLGTGSRVIELDVRDPSQFKIEPVYEEHAGYPEPGPGLAPGVQLEPDTALAEGVELSPETEFAGAEPELEPEHHNPDPETEVAAEAAEPAPPSRRRPSPRPSPRPRPAVDDQGPQPEEPGGVTTLPEESAPDGHDPWKPPAATPEASEWSTPIPALRVQQLVAPEPAVPAFPSPGAEDSEVSEAYLTATAPPGERADGPVQGVGVTLFVANLGRSVAFYRDVLGFQQVDMGLGSAVLEAGNGRIVLRRVVDMAPVDRRLVHLLLEVPDVQAAYDELLLQGVEFVHRPRPVSRYEQLELWSAAFRDPDGHGIALTKWDVRHQD